MSKKILLIEDDPFLGSLLKNRFVKDGLEVVIVKSGGKAVESAKAENPDLILLDIILPGKSGFEIIGELKTDPQLANVPIIIISNLGQESDVERGKELGAADYIIKAKISIDELVDKVKKFLGT